MQLVSVSQSVSGTVSLCSGWVKGSSRGPGWGAGAEGRGRSRQPWRRPSPWEVPLPVQGWSAGCHCTQAMHTYRAALTTHAHIQGCTHYPCTHTGLHSLPMQHAVMHNLQQYTSCCSSHAYHNARLHWLPTQDAVIHNLSFQAMHTYTAALATDATCSDTSNTLALAMHIATHGCTGY